MNQFLAQGVMIARRTATAIPKGSPVKLDSSNPEFVVTSTTSGDQGIIGVTADDSVANGTVNVVVNGIAPVKIQTASGIAVGDFLMNGTVAGKAVEIGATAGTNYNAFAKVLQAPAANDDLVTCIICHSRPQG